MAPDFEGDSNSNGDKSGAIEFPGETNEENVENDSTKDENDENDKNENSEVSESVSEVSATESEVSATESEVSSTNISTSKSEVSSSRTEVSSSKTQISSSKSEVSSSKKPVSSSKEEPISSSKEEPATPSWEEVKQGGTADTSFGVKIPVVSEFNTLALDSRNYWTGETSASNDFSKAFGEALQKYNEAAHYTLDSPIHDSGDYVFHTGVAGDDMGPITLIRDPEKGCYYFYYTVNLNDYDEEGVAINRDLSRFLLALVTSTPTEVEKAIYETQYTAPDGKEPIPLDGTWTKIGDCKIKYTCFKHDPYLVEYKIEPAK